jgi:hypothetical protein
VNFTGADGERFVSLVASRLLVRSINKSRAIVLVGLSNAVGVVSCRVATARDFTLRGRVGLFSSCV